ncbi:RNA polymerase sigma factor [Marinicrinis lubricantis]|uniref:RNA polymerase sigma factor n=1 Tax=Marinicrinis lubricantis TaxID=2086470 RepID=A0ABW1IK91_9BACL
MLTDDQLVKRIAAGDQAAFETLIHRYHAPLQGYLERMLQDAGKAEDFTQETFVRLIRQLRTGRIPEQIVPWLYRVASNLCKDFWKSLKYKYENKSESVEDKEYRDKKPSVVEIYERQETRKELLDMLGQLSETQRQIVILRFYQDLKIQDIADIMGMNLSATKTSLYNALKKLKKYMLQHEDRLEEAGWYER